MPEGASAAVHRVVRIDRNKMLNSRSNREALISAKSNAAGACAKYHRCPSYSPDFFLIQLLFERQGHFFRPRDWGEFTQPVIEVTGVTYWTTVRIVLDKQVAHFVGWKKTRMPLFIVD